MHDAQRRAFNNGLAAARDLVERTATAMRRELPQAQVAALLGDTLDEVADGLTMMQVAPDEARRRSLSLLHS